MANNLNMRRTYLIARRDFLGYVKTVGFWVGLFMPIIFGGLGILMSTLQLDLDPVRYETILDETGRHADAILDFETAQNNRANRRVLQAYVNPLPIQAAEKDMILSAYDSDGLEAAKQQLDTFLPGSASRLSFPKAKRIFVPPPADDIAGMKPYLTQDKELVYEGHPVLLDGLLHIYEDVNSAGAPYDKTEYWSININDFGVKDLAEEYFANLATRDYLRRGNLTSEGLAAAKKNVPDIEFFNPRKSSDTVKGEEVDWTDRIPFYVSIALTFILWLSVFSGSYLLLTSMLEEKLNKLLESMLASAQFSEIIFGKLLGVGAMTLAAMMPYILIGLGGIIYVFILGDAKIMAGLSEAFTPKLIIFFTVFLLLGYVFYGALFIAVGSLAESMQDAQTITTPIMIILTGALVIVMQGVRSPDSALINFASWFPLTAPFASILRLHLDPPWWQLSLSALFLFLLTVGVVWLAGRMFRYGVFSGGGLKALRNWFRGLFGRSPKSDASKSAS